MLTHISTGNLVICAAPRIPLSLMLPYVFQISLVFEARKSRHNYHIFLTNLVPWTTNVVLFSSYRL
jgi:hypothetical protein